MRTVVQDPTKYVLKHLLFWYGVSSGEIKCIIAKKPYNILTLAVNLYNHLTNHPWMGSIVLLTAKSHAL